MLIHNEDSNVIIYSKKLSAGRRKILSDIRSYLIASNPAGNIFDQMGTAEAIVNLMTNEEVIEAMEVSLRWESPYWTGNVDAEKLVNSYRETNKE